MNIGAMTPATVYYKPDKEELLTKNRIWQGIPGIERTNKGRLYVTWYAGGVTEEPGNVLIVEKSDDDGKTWTDGFIVEESCDFKYSLTDEGKIIIDRWSAHTGEKPLDVTIPESIDGYPVAGIASGAFEGRAVARLTLPAYLEEIGAGALDGVAEIICQRQGSSRMILEDGGIPFKFAIPFTDVAGGKWYEDAVRYCYGNSLIEGTSLTTFDPSAEMTRAMFVTVLCSMSGADRSHYTGSSFADVAEGKWYASSVEWAYQNGLAAGDAGNFNPSGRLSRQELATFMFAYARFIGEDVDSLADAAWLTNYSDTADVSTWAFTPMAWAVARGILSGTTTSTLSPKDVSTRAQVAQITMKFTMNTH